MSFFVTNISLYDKDFPNSDAQKKIFFILSVTKDIALRLPF
jgi:hypothetical protein